MKTFEGWYCAHCQRGVDASEVTFHEQHTVCGRTITDDTPPEPPVKDSLTTEQPEDGPAAWLVDYGDGSDPEAYVGERPPGVAVECSMTPLYPESVRAERDALREQLRQLEQRDFQELARANERIDALMNEVRTLRDDRRAAGERVKELEAQVRTAGAIPVKSFVVISEDEDVIEVPDTDLGQALLMLEVARDEEPDKAWSLQAEVDADEARRLRGEEE